MLKIITSRNDYVDVLIHPSLVQGPEAAGQIAAGIAYINERHPETDVIIIGRGGGSIEDLWAFNEEAVARAAAASNIPLISAVGHETDVTISDFVCDVRAETPTAAAEMAVPDTRALREWLHTRRSRLDERVGDRLARHRLRVSSFAPQRTRALFSERLRAARMRADSVLEGMRRDVRQAHIEATGRSERAFANLSAGDPHRIMGRGYSALMDGSGRLVRSVGALQDGMHVAAVLSDGEADLVVESVRQEIKRSG
jgi:exodeoxyribonuclease VII large subunit